jgi:hypothetical protein
MYTIEDLGGLSSRVRRSRQQLWGLCWVKMNEHQARKSGADLDELAVELARLEQSVKRFQELLDGEKRTGANEATIRYYEVCIRNYEEDIRNVKRRMDEARG